ncbi:ABC transporter permease subunit [Cohnella sp. LGH]|uniref:ABC transporter permease subunit n=1 Tax=Cohnella sp. LGH TaxID=1619153 RepID=UPI001ADB3B34|nr:sugar ABC transporter permease [Cohnella sp. LGH]QTH43429.1 ABC transporter permease subunit [Cohnella sp. LGH]
MPKNPEHPKEAFKFIKFYVSQTAQEINSSTGLGMPVLKSVTNSGMWLLEGKPQEHVQVFFDQLNNSKSLPFDPLWSKTIDEIFMREMVHDQQFWTSLKNTFVFSLLTIPLGIAVAFVIALLLNQSIKGVNLYRAAIFLPVGISMISISVIWRWILNTDLGILNYVLSLVNLQGAGWLSDEKYALFSVSAISIWKSVGFNMVILLAGLKGVPSHLYEAATIDGAGAWRRMTRITLPLITPSLFFVSIMSVIGSFQVFDLIYSTTSGGPGDSTRVIYYWVYQNGFKFFEMGYASALAWVVFIMWFAVTLLQMKFFGNKVNYEMD